MKNFTFLLLCLAYHCLSAVAVSADSPIHSKTWKSDLQDLRVVNICNLSEKQLNEFTEGNHPEIAIEFSSQSRLPISFFLRGDLFNLLENEGKFGEVEIKRSFYARFIDQELILSTDLTEWKPLFEFITGNTSVTLSIDDGQPSIVVGAEINHRL